MHPHDAAAVTDAGVGRDRAARRRPARGRDRRDGARLLPRPRAARPPGRALRRATSRSPARLGKPLVVHSRDAAADTFAILERERAGEIGGVLHCFSGTREDGERALALGFLHLARRAADLPALARCREVARALPIERMVVETDAPFLAPQARRGRRNEPAFVAETAAALAAIKGLARARRAAHHHPQRLRALPAPLPARRARDRLPDPQLPLPQRHQPLQQPLHLLHPREQPARQGARPAPGARADGGGDPRGRRATSPATTRWSSAASASRCCAGTWCARSRASSRSAAPACGSTRTGSRGSSSAATSSPRWPGVVDALSVSLNAPDAAALREDLPPGRRASRPTRPSRSSSARRGPSCPSVTASVVALPGVDVEACRRIAEEELGAAFRVRPYNEVG